MTDGSSKEGAGEKKVLRILGLHGNGANSNIMKWQTDMLRSLIGEKAEWEFLDGDEEWTWENAGNYMLDPASEPDGRHSPPDFFMLGVAQGVTFRGWHQSTCDDHSADRPSMMKLFDPAVPFPYNDQIDKNVERVLEHIKTNGPYDIVLGFSSGTVVINIMTGLLRERGEPIPWSLTVLFSSVRPRDERFYHLFAEPFKQPAIIVYGRKGKPKDFRSQMEADWANQYSKDTVTKFYENPTVMEHNGGHELPRSGTQEKFVCKKVVSCIFKHFGMSE